MKVHDRRVPFQPFRTGGTPRFAWDPETGCAEPQPAQSLIHCLDLRGRYRREEAQMRRELDSLETQLEAASREVGLELAAGLPVAKALRELCDQLLGAVSDVERDLSEVRAAIDGLSEEIAMRIERRLGDLVFPAPARPPVSLS